MESWPAPTLPRLEPTTLPLRLYDTASRQVVAVGPQTGTARLYVCGITPYDATHLGHAFTYLTFDLINRAWRDRGLAVAYTQNITDVDDPLLERATATGADWRELALSQIDLFRADMTALRVLPPDHYLGVVESLPLVVALIEELAASGAIYQIEDSDYPDWYFRTSETADFGAISHLDPAAMLAIFAERGGDPERPGKTDPLDALVWRLARPGEPAWESALGRGRPGWHIECTAIARATLGESFDLQGGGMDLVFPHHEICAAQAAQLGATGSGIASPAEGGYHQLAKSYAHAAMVGLDGEKMSKSKGNLVLVSQLLAEGADPMAIRLALLAHHYRLEFSWTKDDLDQANRRLTLWQRAANEPGGTAAEPVIAALRQVLAEDLRTDQALTVVDAWAELSLAATTDRPAERAQVIAAIDALLGVELVPTAG